jgi:hypothetical protein
MKPFGRRRPQRQSLLCPFGFLAIRFEVFYALAPLLTYMLRMLSEVWFDPKQIVVRPEAIGVRPEAASGSTRSMTARRQPQRGTTALWRQETYRLAA